MSATVKTVANALKKTQSAADVSSLARKLAPEGLYNKNGKDYSYSVKTSSQNVMPVNAKFIERDEISDDQLKAQAKEYAENSYKNKSEALDINTAKKLNALNKNLNENERKKQTFYQTAEEEFAAAKEKIVQNSVRNGIANSSIFDALNLKAESEYIAKISAAAEEYGNLAESIKAEMDLVNASKELSLRDYELKKAAEYEKRLAELRKAELEARKEVNEYNKHVADFMANYDEIIQKTLEEWRKAKENGSV